MNMNDLSVVNVGDNVQINGCRYTVVTIGAAHALSVLQNGLYICNDCRWGIIWAYISAFTDLTFAAPQKVESGGNGADEHGVRSGNTFPVRFPQFQVRQKHLNNLWKQTETTDDLLTVSGKCVCHSLCVCGSASPQQRSGRVFIRQPASFISTGLELLRCSADWQ